MSVPFEIQLMFCVQYVNCVCVQATLTCVPLCVCTVDSTNNGGGNTCV